MWFLMFNLLFFLIEVNESGGWVGDDLLSYGLIFNLEGYIEIDYCGFWFQCISYLLSFIIFYEDFIMLMILKIYVIIIVLVY